MSLTYSLFNGEIKHHSEPNSTCYTIEEKHNSFHNGVLREEGHKLSIYELNNVKTSGQIRNPKTMEQHTLLYQSMYTGASWLSF